MSCNCWPAGTTIHSVCIWAEIRFYVSSSTFKAAGWWQLWVTQQIDAEHLDVRLTVRRVDARAEVVSRAQRPAARVLVHVIKGRRSADKTGQFIDLTNIDKYCKKSSKGRGRLVLCKIHFPSVFHLWCSLSVSEVDPSLLLLVLLFHKLALSYSGLEVSSLSCNQTGTGDSLIPQGLLREYTLRHVKFLPVFFFQPQLNSNIGLFQSVSKRFSVTFLSNGSQLE